MKTTKYEYTCDKCLATKQVGFDCLPDNWVRAKIIQSAMDGEEGKGIEFDLCPDCAVDILGECD